MRGFRSGSSRVLITTDLRVVLLSATMPSDVLEVTVYADPIRILVKEGLTLEGIRQFYVHVARGNRGVN
ncbi:hypothetical protein FKM82_027465 [Ascaphus truei]